ncbi:MAG: hypothetical protein NC313_05765 [Butyrivibrio sp.]|nr:hypothetical protein [Butyrivibrio sp.]
MKKTLRKMSVALLIILQMSLIWGCGITPIEQMQAESSNVMTSGENDSVMSDTESDNTLLNDKNNTVLSNAKDANALSNAKSNNTLLDAEPKDNKSGNVLSDNEETMEIENNSENANQADINKNLFYEKADSQHINRSSADAYFQTLIDDDIFQDDSMALTGLIIEDMDGNGQNDMLITVAYAKEIQWYGSGCLWIYMNDDEPYCFAEEDCSYHGYFDVFSADIDNDENTEIVFSAQGSGCGAVGDSYKAIFKYKDHHIERMELPSTLNSDYDCGITVTISQTSDENSYYAYCPYFDEMISFSALNSMEPPSSTRTVGGNVRGFFDLKCVEYEGKNALQASEYLNGEGGIVHCVATAQFLIVWDENGEPSVAKWWILMDGDSSNDGSSGKIAYADESLAAMLHG